MRVAILGNGTAVHTVRWANGLSDAGVQVVLLSAHGQSDELVPDVRVHQLFTPPPAGYYLNALQVSHLLRRERVDLLHVHYASGYGTLGRLSRFLPLVLSAWGSDVYDFPATPARRRILIRNLNKATQLCATSHTMAEHIQRLWRPDRALAITPFGVDTALFTPRAAPPGEDCPIVVGTIKRLTPTYGIDTLIRGFAGCVERLAATGGAPVDRVRLRIVGHGPSRDELQRLAERLGIAERTTFVGAVPHRRVAEELRKLDVFVAVSRRESFGVAVVEASASGLPVVVSNVGGLPEVVEDGTTGLIVPPEDPAALAGRLVRLVTHRTLRQQFGAAGRRRVQDKYEWSRCVEIMLRVYDNVLRRQKRAA